MNEPRGRSSQAPREPRDPRSGPVADAVYRAHQAGWSEWTRLRRRRDFDDVEAFLLFAGYPRSGHSVVGACINAHPDAVVSHELDAAAQIERGVDRDRLYARILTRARWFHLRGDRSNYSYVVPGGWQGRYRRLRVIGDKRGGAVTRAIAADPDFLVRTRRLVGVPLRLIHVTRDPWDSIAAISRWHRLSPEASAELYFEHCRTTARLGELCECDELLSVSHENLLATPEPELRRIAAFLGLEPDQRFLAGCGELLFERPTRSAESFDWPAGLSAAIGDRVADIPHLAAYRQRSGSAT